MLDRGPCLLSRQPTLSPEIKAKRLLAKNTPTRYPWSNQERVGFFLLDRFVIVVFP
jgi:hypothetical protein